MYVARRHTVQNWSFYSANQFRKYCPHKNTISLQGTAINCNSGPVTDGYVQILLNGVIEFAGITNGIFDFTFINCQDQW